MRQRYYYSAVSFSLMFLAALVVGLTVPLVFTKQASAAYARCNPDGTGSGGSGSLRCGPANSQEIAALASCGSATNRAGAIWISNNSTSYYAAEVNVANGAVSVPVVIRGSVNNCAGTWSTVTGAKNISSTSGRISGIPDTSSSSPTVLNRGTSPGSPYAWSGQGGSLPATLNVAGLAVAPPYKETITIPLYRCFYDISLQEYGTTCGTAYIPVTIIRDAPPPKVWSISGTTSVAISGDGTASPGNKITWTHKVTNDGPDATTTSISSWSARSDGWSGTRDTGSSSGAKGQLRSFTDTKTISQGDAGSRFCDKVTFTPQRGQSPTGGTGSSNEKCVAVPYNFSLNPTISTIPGNGDIADQDSTQIKIGQAVVENNGPTISFRDEEWQVTRVVYNPGQIPSLAGTSTAPPCDYAAPNRSCSALQNGTNVTFQPNPSSTTVLSNYPDPIGQSLPVGSKICYILSVSKWSWSSAIWKHSAPACIAISQVPFVRVLGNDLRVGSTVTGSGNQSSIVLGKQLSTGASSVEYGILAPGSVANIGSLSGVYTGNPGDSGQSVWSKLTFANPGIGACAYGCFTGASSMGAIPNIKSFFGQSLSGVEVVHTCDLGTSDFSGGLKDLGNFGASLVVVCDGGTVTISRDIKYMDSQPSGNPLPQLVIIANNINITSGVKQVDAWLVADSTVNTCSDVSSPTQLDADTCKDALVINGAVAASKLMLNRTHYNKANPDEVAETINLRGDAYVWANKVSRANGYWQTTYTTDLPPRY